MANVGGVSQRGQQAGDRLVKFLFLDIDGVLNAHEYVPEVGCGQIHPDKVARLNRVLVATDAKIVLSSAWRYLCHRNEMNLTGLGWLLRSHGVLKDRLIGITQPDTMRSNAHIPSYAYSGVPSSWPVGDERGQQIHHWLKTFSNGCYMSGAEVSYAVVDDLDLGITAAGHPFVQTDGAVGLTDADADRLIELLGANIPTANKQES